jgi:acetyl-CoA C-acetyltransferase
MTSAELTPVLVGVAQLEQRSRNPDQIKEPLDMMLAAVRDAAADTGSSKLLQQASAVRVIRGIWSYQNPAAALAESLGCTHAETALTSIGGNYVQTVVNRSALDIQSGRHDIVVITGAEWRYSRARARREGRQLATRDAPGTPEVYIGDDVSMSHEAERALGLVQPIQIYPMFENALRYAKGESIADHLQRIARLWARFSDVAAANPHAWIRVPCSADAIGTPSAQNRPVSFPYPKLMNANNDVDQAAALILCAASTARRLGIPEQKWIYPWAGTDAHDHLYVSNRDNLHSSPAIRIAGRRCLELAATEPNELDLIDVYSCFPSAVQVAAQELCLDQTRPLTVTGGMTFSGGPLNNYVMHSIARMAELLRGRTARGLITANGGYLTKHAFGVYSSIPPERPFRHEDLQHRVDATPKRALAVDYRGPATVESYTVLYAPGNAPGEAAPSLGYLACLAPDGRRAWARIEDAALLCEMADREQPREFCGRKAKLGPSASAEII